MRSNHRIKSKLVLVFFLPFFSLSLSAQGTADIDVELGPIFRADERAIPLDLVGSDDSGYYVLFGAGKFGQREKTLRKFNLNLTPTNQKLQLISDESSEALKTLGIIQIGDKILHISAQNSPYSINYYYQKLNLGDFSIDAPKPVVTVNSDRQNMNQSIQRFIVARDTSKVMLFYSVPNGQKEFQRVAAKTFTPDFEEISSHEYEFPFTNKQFQLHTIYLENNGDLLLIAKRYLSNKILREEENAGYEYLVYRLSEGNVREIGKFQTLGKHIRQFKTIYAKNGDLIFAGIFSERIAIP